MEAEFPWTIQMTLGEHAAHPGADSESPFSVMVEDGASTRFEDRRWRPSFSQITRMTFEENAAQPGVDFQSPFFAMVKDGARTRFDD